MLPRSGGSTGGPPEPASMPLDRDSAFLAALGASIAAHIVGAGVAAFVRPELAHAAVILRDGPV